MPSRGCSRRWACSLCTRSRGRGHHFGWKIHPTSPAFRSLARIGRVSPALERTYAAPQPPDGEPVDPAMGKAFAGLGLVIEYVAHRILAEAQPACPIPILPEAVDMGPQERGKEIIVLDISEYGDPLHTRAVRMPFSIYLKPWLHTDILTPEIEGRMPVMVMVPAGETGDGAGYPDHAGPGGKAASGPPGQLPVPGLLAGHGTADRAVSAFRDAPVSR